MSVRYLNYEILFDSSRLRLHLLDKGMISLVKVGRSVMMCGKCQEIFDENVKCFREDPYFILKNPTSFRPREIPMDGNKGPNIPKDGKNVTEI